MGQTVQKRQTQGSAVLALAIMISSGNLKSLGEQTFKRGNF